MQAQRRHHLPQPAEEPGPTAPAQRLLTGMPVLANVPVPQAMAPPRLMITGGTPPAAARREIERAGVSSAPVVDGEGRFEGTVSLGDLQADRGTEANAASTSLVDVIGSDCVRSPRISMSPSSAMAAAAEHWVPVLDAERKVIGTIATSDVVRGYRLGLLASLQKVNAEDDRGGTDTGADRIGIPRWSD